MQRRFVRLLKLPDQLDLSFKHHAEFPALPPKQQDRLLERATAARVFPFASY
jgi:hypothetical protein